MKRLDRRTFLKSSLLGAASFSLFPSIGAEPGANSDIRFAVVGFNGRGKSHISGFSEVKGTRLVALCDADQKVLDREMANWKEPGKPVQGYTDIRKLLENKE